MNMRVVGGRAVIVAVGERDAVCGLVWESGSELRDLNLAAPSRTAVRGGAVPHIVLTGAVVHPRDMDFAGLAALDRWKERPCAHKRPADCDARRPAGAPVLRRSIPDAARAAVSRS